MLARVVEHACRLRARRPCWATWQALVRGVTNIREAMKKADGACRRLLFFFIEMDN